MSVVRNRRRAKEVERRLAKKLGARRVGILGKEDLSHPQFSFEVKERKKVAISKWFEQAEKNANNKIPALIIHEYRKNHDQDFVVLRLKDFLALIKAEGGSGGFL